MDFIREWRRLEQEASEISASKGFENKRSENFGQIIALMHSELSEALEGARHGNPPSDHIHQYSAIEEEFADVVIRIMGCAYDRGYDVAGAILEKIEFNRNREYKHGSKLF